ncbi:MAG: GNAT family N-acetyltransferase, partial [Pedosphaera parvula]|nr:GNAT family N-acetyltransferase [Pedosphaera parvula]
YLPLRLLDAQRRQAALNLYVSRACHRQGFASEALAALLGFCFRGIALHRVVAACDIRNVAACRLFEKVGMRREGEFQKDRFINGEWVTTAYYARLNEEYHPPAG